MLFVALSALAITWPAYFANKVGTPVAFYAVTQITTIGLYVAYVAPVFLRVRAGNRFKPGPWTLGKWGPLVGWVADRFGPRWALGIGAASGLAAAIVGIRYLATYRHLRVRIKAGRPHFSIDDGGRMTGFGRSIAPTGHKAR